MNVSLTRDDLNETDERVVEILSEGRATPQLIRKELKADGDDFTRQYISQILRRLNEHGHIENLRNTGVYELVSDPRDEEGTET